MTRMISITSLFFIFSSFFIPLAHAQPLETIVSTPFTTETIVKGFTLQSTDGLMRLGIRPNTLNGDTRIDMKTIDPSLMADSFAASASLTGKTAIGNIYLFDILNKESYDGKDFFFLEIKYPTVESIDAAAQETTRRMHGKRTIYFYNGTKKTWEELPSEDNPITQSVRARIHLPYARLIIVEEMIPEIGAASWYGYKGCDCAASPDYPKGTMLVVSRIDDPTKTVTVKVNDYGPDRSVHPERIIDLDKVAFKKLARLGAGVTDVRVRPLR